MIFLVALGVGLGLLNASLFVRDPLRINFIMIGFILTFAAVLFRGIFWVDETACKRSGTQAELEVEWYPIGGCYVEIDGRFIPFDERAIPIIVDNQ